MRAGGAGAGYGAVEGYLDPIEPDLADAAERIPGSLTAALMGGATAAAGAAGLGGLKCGYERYRAAQQGRREAEAQAQREALARRQEAGRKAAETRRRNKELTAEYEAEEAGRQKRLESRSRTDLAKQYEAEYDQFPKNPSPEWKANRDAYQRDRTGYIMARLNAGRDLNSIARSLKMKPVQLARYVMTNKAIPKEGRYEQAIRDVVRMIEAEKAWKAKGLPKPK
jgi:hypothetical protein